MTNSEAIKARIRDQKKTQASIAEDLGIRQSSLSLKINNKRPFYVDEAVKLAHLLNIETKDFGSYFFSR